MKPAILFVDDDDNVRSALKRSMRSLTTSYDLAFASDGYEALQMLAQRSFDVVVSDLHMPTMDGPKLLEAVTERHPQTVRLILAGTTDQELALRSTRYAHQFLAKPCESPQVLAAIERATLVRNLLQNESLRKLVAGLKQLPSLPMLYFELVDQMRSPDASLEKVGDIIGRDVAMTARVLQLVNSAFFGLPRRISNPRDAATYLGLDTLKSLVLLINLFQSFPNGKPVDMSIEELWEHSRLVAAGAKAVMMHESADRASADEAFVAGMLHDLGKLLLLNAPGYAGMVRRLVDYYKCPVVDAEYRALGTSHAEVGAYLLGLWGLPEPVVRAVAFHHLPSKANLLRGVVGAFTPLAAVHVANAFLPVKPKAIEMVKADLDNAWIEKNHFENRIDDWLSVVTKIRGG